LNHVAGIFTYNSTVILAGNASIQGLGNKHSGTQGNALSLNGTPLTLSGNASVYDAGNTCRRNIVANSGLVTIADRWNGTASIQFPAGAFAGGTVPGATIGTSYATATTYTGKLYAENVSVAAKELTPQVLANNGQLQVGKTYIQNTEGIHWYPDNAAAVAAYEEGDVIKLITTEALDLAGKELYVDFGGQKEVNVTGEGTLYGIDTATVGDADAVASVTGAVTTAPFAVDPLTGITYVFHEGGFYPIQVRNTGMTLQPANMGLYFDATVQYHPDLENYINAYGIRATLPQFEDMGYLYGEVEGAPEDIEGNFHGFISGIMGEDLPNDETGVALIRAGLYVKLVIGDEEHYIYTAERDMSFKQAMLSIDAKWDKLVEDHARLLDMYRTYYNVMKDWDLVNIDTAYNDSAV
jgi:hypothetical protein